MNKAARRQPKQQRKQQKKVVNQVVKRTKTTKATPLQSQQSSTASIQQQQSFAPKLVQQSLKQRHVTPFTQQKQQLSTSTFKNSLSTFTAPSFTPKRHMSMGTHTRIKSLVPCDPRFEDDEVISMLNHKTGLMEPIIVAVPEPSFEWIFSSPVDLHTFDVIPVVKDCIDPENPTFESMDA